MTTSNKFTLTFSFNHCPRYRLCGAGQWHLSGRSRQRCPLPRDLFGIIRKQNNIDLHTLAMRSELASLQKSGPELSSEVKGIVNKSTGKFKPE